MTAPEELLLDLPALAAGHDYFSLGSWDVTPDGRLLAWTEDTVSRRQYTLHVRDLSTGERLAEHDRQLLRRRRLGQRQSHPVLHREGPGHAPRLSRPPPSARQRPEERPGGLGGEGQRLLHRDRQVEIGPLHRDLLAEHGLDRGEAARRRPAERTVSPLPAARTRSRVLRRGSGRPVRRPHQLAGEELPPDGRPGGDDRRPLDLDRARGRTATTSSSTISRPSPVSSRSPSARRAFAACASSRSTARPSATSSPTNPTRPPGWTTTPSRRRRSCATALTSLRTPVSTFELDLATGERVLLKQKAVLGGFDASRYVTERALPARPRRRPGAGLAPLPQGVRSGRQGAAPARGLRLLRLLERSLLRLRRPVAGRSRLRLRDRPCPRRPGDGAFLVRGRQAPAEEEHLLRLHRRHRGAGRAPLRRPRPGLRAWAAAPAAC